MVFGFDVQNIQSFEPQKQCLFSEPIEFSNHYQLGNFCFKTKLVLQ